MRLERIKLAGFKSFVDPTTVVLPGALVGIVGPNGCGKSNIIDAVRWVMGESSAKTLRSESMADVIFNGSASRKPVGVASVELVFDNSDGRAGGQYAQYNQIAIKRQVSRDGQSIYLLNGTRCRRRDITDLFLGTGLGPRSYSIIEQGMISRVIEAKPEDLRNYLEEAAGISRYKERRRETENRIRHTRENLDRLNDLREEVAKQIERLKRQARAAERYQSLRDEERRTRAEWLALRIRALREELEQADRRIAEAQNAHEAAVAGQRRAEREIETARAEQTEAHDSFNAVQRRYYEVGADIARVEQSIAHSREARSRIDTDLATLGRTLQQLHSQRETDLERRQGAESALSDAAPDLDRHRTDVEAAQRALVDAESVFARWQQDWEQLNDAAADPRRKADVHSAEAAQIRDRLTELERRATRVAEELAGLGLEAVDAECTDARRGHDELTTAQSAAQETLSGARDAVTSARTALQSRATELDAAAREHHRLAARADSLKALQRQAFDADGKAPQAWLGARGLDRAPRLAATVRVTDRRWRDAVEAVLGDWLAGVGVADLDAMLGADAPPKGVRLIATGAGESPAAGTLAAKVESAWPLAALLGQVRCADDSASARAMRAGLGAHESVITPDGLWLGRSWARVAGQAGAQIGLLAREDELREVDGALKSAAAAEQQARAQRDAAQGALATAEQSREDAQRALNDGAQRLGDARARLRELEARRQHASERRDALQRERSEIERLRGELSARADALAAAADAARSALAEFDVQREDLATQRDGLQSAVLEARDAARSARERAHALELRLGELRATVDATATAIDRSANQIRDMEQRSAELAEAAAHALAPLAEYESSLKTYLERRVEVERELSAARNRLETIEARLRELDTERAKAERAVGERREVFDNERMARQEVAARSTGVSEQLAETGHELEAVLGALPDQADVQGWAERLERLATQIERLGPINLAAIDEHREQSERMAYLDAQHADLTESLDTLEGAMRKIDRETRTRFKETFDRVDAGVKEMFPRLFGGGHAYLELTGEDLLETGVSIMARPPGKRNTNITQLSGGEKALTAVALVFSIFQLNPSPFCLLDEVDAPLDDANVGRFCEMVKAMSADVQFIFITHNKLTMEIAAQLTGVTMHEPGVSRLVSVDVDAAVAMTA